MVTVVKYERKNNKEGGSFLLLTIEGGVTMSKSETTGTWFAQTLKTNILANMDEKSAKALVGQKIPGKIIKRQCTPYTYCIPTTGEEKLLDYTYEYDCDEVEMETLAV